MNHLLSLKANLITGMDERRMTATEFVTQLSPDMAVHTASDWTVKDLITHLTAFEEDMIDAIQHFMEGKSYRLDLRGQMSIDGFNEVRRQERAHKSWEEALDDWQMVRDQLRGVIMAFPEDKLEIPFSTPFLQKYDLIQAIKGCGVHEKMHMNDIKAVVNA